MSAAQTLDDVPAVVPMVEQLAAFLAAKDPARYEPLPTVGDLYRSWLVDRAKDKRSVFLVAERLEGKLAGFLVGTCEREIPIYRLKEYGIIHDVWVEPDYRNEGLARHLVTLAIEQFRTIGMRQVRLDVLIDNAPARALFESCGLRSSILEMLTDFGSEKRPQK